MSNPQHGELSHRARKRFGQNFLVDQGVIQRIVRAIAPRDADQVVEIGPGKGAITELLVEEINAEAGGRLNVVELDRDLVPWLHMKFDRYAHFALHQADALKFDFGQLIEADKPLRIVGNLPYNISTPLIFHLLGYHGRVKDMHFMLQKEVVDRMGAQPGDKAYGRLGIMVQYYCRVDCLFPVPPGCFQPAPKVDSAIVRLTPHAAPPFPARNLKLLERLVNVAFQQRRKTLRNALKQLLPVEQIDQLELDTGRRPENLSLEEFVALSDTLDTLIKGASDGHE